jgi:hypothetical protein
MLAFVDVALPQGQDCTAPQRVHESLWLEIDPERDGATQEAPALGPVTA